MPDYFMCLKSRIKIAFGCFAKTRDLYKIRDLLKENYPEDSSINKTAIVVEDGLQSNMAKAFVRIAKDMPHEFRVFSSLAEAESWVKK
ncbi:MAG: hypothetical protein P8X68_21070 [Desulfobacterales bacterium]